MMSNKTIKKEISRSERRKYLDTMLADMGLQSLDELSSEERGRWKKAVRPSPAVEKKLKEMGYSINSNNNKRSLGSYSQRLVKLSLFLSKKGLKKESQSICNIIKISAIPGIESPIEETDIEGVDKAIRYLQKNPGLAIHLDSPIGTSKWTVNNNPIDMPFHYGEFLDIINPSDDMGWDLVVAPSCSDMAEEDGDIHYISGGHNLQPVGYIPVNPSEELWRANTISREFPKGKSPPIGNDKIILSEDGEIGSLDKQIIKEFFNKIWNFSDIVWL